MAGVARTVITPPLGIRMVGYTVQAGCAQGVERDLTATVLVLSDGLTSVVIADAIQGARGALVFEAGRKNDLVITRRKGTGAVTAIAHGKAAHAGNAHKEGANAVWALAKLVDRAQGLTDYARGVTVNVGKVTGGTSKNTVPDRAEALIDLRFETRADGEALVSALRAIASECATLVQGTRIEIEGGIARLPLERTDASVRLMESYGEAAVLAEAALSEDWSRPEEDVAWSHLQGQSLFRNPQGISKTGIPRAGL